MIVAVIVSFGTVFASAADLISFCSDGCTAYTEGTQEEPTIWRHCCIQHDFKYWIGGTEEQRLQADKDLRACVKATGNPFVAQLMYRGVRMFGGPERGTSYGWGFGWSEMRPYGPFTPEENEKIKEKRPIATAPLPICKDR